MKPSLQRVEINQLETSLFRDINLFNAINQGADPLTDPLCKIPSHAGIRLFVECLDACSAEFVPAFRGVIRSYYEGVSLDDPTYKPLQRIFATVEAYKEIDS